MAVKITDLPSETGPTEDDLLVIRDNNTGTTRKIAISDFFDTFSYRFTPVGSVLPFGGGGIPNGFLLCDGSPVDRTTYAALFDVVGTNFGPGNGVDTFNLPDMRGRVVVGKAASGTFATINNSGGAETVMLTLDQMPIHSHTHNNPVHAHGVNDPGHGHTIIGPRTTGPGSDKNGNGVPPHNSITHANNFIIGTTGSGTGISIQLSGIGLSINPEGGLTPHNNLQPYRVLNYIIKV